MKKSEQVDCSNLKDKTFIIYGFQTFTDKNYEIRSIERRVPGRAFKVITEQTHNARVKITMENDSSYRKTNWDWVFTLPFILMLIYLLL